MVAHASTCRDAARAAELRTGIPKGLLAAIGRVESGSWSWSVNSNGIEPGQRFNSVDDAERYAQGQLATGNRMIDLGCFQIDLLYHQELFTQWQDAFDSERNAQAAAGILSQLHQRTGNWDRAVALYHSADPNRGQSYLQLVKAAWTGFNAQLDNDSVPASPEAYGAAAIAYAFGVAVWVPGMAGPTRRAAHGGAHALPNVVTP